MSWHFTPVGRVERQKYNGRKDELYGQQKKLVNCSIPFLDHQVEGIGCGHNQAVEDILEMPVSQQDATEQAQADGRPLYP